MSVFVCLHAVREDKYLKLHGYGGSGVQDFYKYNVCSAAMAFSEDGSLFAYCDGAK